MGRWYLFIYICCWWFGAHPVIFVLSQRKYSIIIYVEYFRHMRSYAKISSLKILPSMLRACQYQMKHIYLYSFLFFIVLQSVYNNLVWVLSSVCGNHHNIISFSVCVKKYSSNFILLLTMSWKLIRFVPYVMLDCVLRMTL